MLRRMRAEDRNKVPSNVWSLSSSFLQAHLRSPPSTDGSLQDLSAQSGTPIIHIYIYINNRYIDIYNIYIYVSYIYIYSFCGNVAISTQSRIPGISTPELWETPPLSIIPGFFERHS